ncbi:ATP-binding protein [Actinacidiphila glaucinigra]|uniref:HD domain-containing protein n=1 Tax=Actinacidiphila glaucinigra TaxID=235986 RepID=UPI0037CA764B
MEELLGRIGQFGFFDEYTKHDITHIDAMLVKLDWLVTAETRKVMTPADWLLIVLSVYFHDLGMLVTKREYERRATSKFHEFCADSLVTADADGRDYSAQLRILTEEQREKFLYQEFVRYHHAARVRKWIEGDTSPDLGGSDEIVNEIQRILTQLDPVFKEDLAKVCESHHLDDLFDTKKYPVEQYYGSGSSERANVQFAAVLLRTVDLLHVTRDRTPSVAFRVLNPADPISQNEWAKQSAVRAVVPAWGFDEEGNLSEDAPRDTISVHATFTDENGFFGLTYYLKYAAEQLRKSFDWIQRSNSKLGTKYYFPWRVIDTSRVEAKGFLTEPFQFTIDQEKVLDLLTGHTLYNDSNVVLRELLQNAIDAVRLQHGSEAPVDGNVSVRWNSAERTLEVWDNGTGMTQGVIENNLLKAGSSLYQDPEFRKKNPKFNPISRFGIGVLSTFMVADQVEIITCHPEEDKARQLSLRSVHGQYLVRTLEKNQEVPDCIRPHGTIVKLKVRPSAELRNVTQTTKTWVVIPGCRVTVQEDDGELVSVGHASVKEALTAAIKLSGSSRAQALEQDKIRVIERQDHGMSIAYAVQWNEYFREWIFMALRESARRGVFSPPPTEAGVCVGGIRVEQTTPGFRGRGPIWALANAYGPTAPRTNVARSALDPTPEFRDFVGKCYEAYCAHVIEEVKLLQADRQYSITWATEEAAFIAGPLLNQGNPVSQPALKEAVKDIPFFLIEEDGVRKQVAANYLGRFDCIETTESAVTEHIEHLLRELPGGTRESVIKLLNNAQQEAQNAPHPILCSHLGRSDEVDDFFLANWEIAAIRGNVENRSCSVTWTKMGGLPKWTYRSLSGTALDRLEKERDSFSGRFLKLARLPVGEVEITGFDSDVTGVIIGDTRYLLPGHPWQSMLDELLDGGSGAEDERVLLLCWLISQRVFSKGRERYYGITKPSSLPDLQEYLGRNGLFGLIDFNQFSKIAQAVEGSVEFFDTRKWKRWGGYFEGGI